MLNYIFINKKKIIFIFFIPLLFLIIIFFFDYDSLFLMLSLNCPLVNSNINNNKALIVYDPNWWKKRKDYYNEMFFFKNNVWIAFFAMFLGFVNFLISNCLNLIMGFFMPEDFVFEINIYESASNDLLTDIHMNLDQIILNNYSYFLIYIGIFSLIIPISVFSYSLSFKRLFVFTLVLFEFSLILILFACYALMSGVLKVWWTKYTPFNYWYGDVGLSTTVLNLSFFFHIISIILFSFIFFNTIFFKKSKNLSFFSVFKLCFFFLIIFSFVIYSICWYEVHIMSLLCSPSIRMEYLYSIVDWTLVYEVKLTYYNKSINVFFFFSSVSIFFFFINQQIDNNSDNYKILIFDNLYVWIFLIIGSFLLLLIFKFLAIYNYFRFVIRFSFLVFCFGSLVSVFLKKMNNEMISNFSFILNLVFLNVCSYFIYYILLVPFNIKLDFLSNIIKFRDFTDIDFNTFAFYNQLELIFYIIKFIPFFGVIHWYFDYFPSYKLNFRILVIEFILLFFGIFTVLISTIRMLINDLIDPVTFIILYKNEYYGINPAEKQWIESTSLGFEFMCYSFIVLIIACIFAVCNFFYKNRLAKKKQKKDVITF